MDPQTDDDLGFEDTLDTTDIFGPDVDLIRDPVTGYVRPMTTQEIEQGSFDTRMSYAAPDTVLDQNIGNLSSATFDTNEELIRPYSGLGESVENAPGEERIEAYLNSLHLAQKNLFEDQRDTLPSIDFNIDGFDTGPDVDTTAPSGLTGSTGLLGDPINLGAVSPIDQLGMGVEFENTPNAGFTDTPGVGTETPSVTGASPSGYNSLEEASNYNQSFDPTKIKYDNATGLYTPTDLDLGTGTTVNDATGNDATGNVATETAINPYAEALESGYDTINDTEAELMRDIMATERHEKDGPPDPETGQPMYKAGDLVFDERGIDKFNSAANPVIGFFLQGISNGIFGRNFSKNQAKNLVAKNKKALEALQKTGKYAYSEDGKTAIGVVDTDGTVIKLNTDPSVVEENDNDSDPYPVCEPGYVLVNGVCVPDDSLGAGDGGSGTDGGIFRGPIIRPTTPRTPRTPVVPQPTMPAPTIRAPKQFAMGGEVSPGLITAADRFLASLKG